jgi:hypothetical protein
MTRIQFADFARFTRVGLSFAAFILLAACGGEVSSGGSGGSGGAGGAGGEGGMNPTGGGSQQDCLDFCHKLQTSNCMQQIGDCTEFCSMVYGESGAECADEVDALFACWLPSASMCLNDPPAACQPQVDTMEACKDIYGCGPTVCSAGGGPGGESECGCSQTCAMKEQSTSCTQGANGIACECSVNGMIVGTCQGMGELECGIAESCCAMFFTK